MLEVLVPHPISKLVIYMLVIVTLITLIHSNYSSFCVCFDFLKLACMITSLVTQKSYLLIYPTDEVPVSTTETININVDIGIDIRTTIIVCVSVVAVMGWIALCCLFACVIQFRRKRSKEQ